MSTETLKRSSDETSCDHLTKKTKTSHEENEKEHQEKSHDVPTKIHYATIFTPDLAKSQKYYEEVFGFKKSPSGGFEDVWVEMKSNGADKLNGSAVLSFHKIHADDKSHHPGEITFGFFVKNLDKFHESIAARTDTQVISKPSKQPWGGVIAEYKGIDNVAFTVIETDCEMDSDAASKSETKKEEPVKKEESTGCGICHFELPCEDMKRAEKFYSAVFGWTFTPYNDEFCMFDTHHNEYKLLGGLTLEKDTTKRIHYPANYLVVKDIDASIKTINQNGGEVITEKIPLPGNYGFRASFKDTEGNLMAMWQKP